jgi:hypothetical protein
MSISDTYERLHKIAVSEYADLVVRGDLLRLPSGEVLKLRLHLADESFVEVNVSSTGATPITGNDAYLDGPISIVLTTRPTPVGKQSPPFPITSTMGPRTPLKAAKFPTIP